ncbi:MAG: hypothetical protein PHG66_01655 [Candidatus Colwellbacteria bacterium]|nr:hypothetical protein [Candidatus Colwellbacteria bacterium]
MSTYRNTPLTENNVDSIVLNTLKNNKFSSVAFIAHITRLPVGMVDESVNRLVHRRKIYLSTGGVPKRYSHSDELMGWTDTEEEYQESKRFSISVQEGTIIH